MINAQFALVILISSSHAMAKPSDIRLCETYPAVNTAHRCSADNYLMQFGYKYCRKYVKLENQFQPGTQTVLAKIRSCLVTLTANDKRLTCANSEALAMKHHLYCYKKAGFCNLPWLEIGEIGWVAKGELDQSSFRKTMAEVIRQCDFI